MAVAPHPPGDYDVVVVGSGPGGLQTSYFLGRLAVEDHVEGAAAQALAQHALLRREDLLVERVCDRLELGPAKVGEEGELPEPLGDACTLHRREPTVRGYRRPR